MLVRCHFKPLMLSRAFQALALEKRKHV